MAQELRRTNTQVRSGLGFGSPYRGEDARAALQFDPMEQDLPPELLTLFGAAPETETDFVRAFLMETSPDRQAELLEQVSPDFAAMLEVGWKYLHNREVSTRPMAAHDQVHADLTAHPVMGMAAQTEDYHVQTVEDMGIAAKDAGIGWKEANTFVEASAIDTVADATRREGPVSQQELRQMIQVVLRQMGVQADVSIQAISGPSEVHIREST
jgi:hypothetical protein